MTDGYSFVTSLPDVLELGLPLAEWIDWFRGSAQLVLSRCPEMGVVIFYQTDIKVEGRWIDKSFLCMHAALDAGVPLLWHKIVCRVPPGSSTRSRPSYAHLLCFSSGIATPIAASTPDVIAVPGPKLWSRGIEVGVCRSICRFIRSQTETRTIVDPFCGIGTVLKIALRYQFDTIGIDKSPGRCRKAQRPGLNV